MLKRAVVWALNIAPGKHQGKCFFEIFVKWKFLGALFKAFLRVSYLFVSLFERGSPKLGCPGDVEKGTYGTSHFFPLIGHR